MLPRGRSRSPLRPPPGRARARQPGRPSGRRTRATTSSRDAEVRLVGDVVRDVLERRRGAHCDPAGPEVLKRLEPLPCAFEVAAPDVAPVDRHRRRRSSPDSPAAGAGIAPRPRSIGDRLDGGCGQGAPRRCGQLRVRAPRRGSPDARQRLRAPRTRARLRRRARSADTGRLSLTSAGSSSWTHSAPAARRAARSSTYTGRTSSRRSSGRKAAALSVPATPAEASVALESASSVTGPTMTGRVTRPSRARLDDLAHEAIRREGEDGLGPDLGNQIVVVRVEPLRHLERCENPGTARRGEVGVESDRAVLVAQVREALGQGAHRERGIQNLVVVRERLGDRRVAAAEAQLDQALAGLAAQLGGCGLELGLGERTRPVRLDGALELATAPDTRVAEDRAGREVGSVVGHRAASRWLGWVRTPASRRTASTVS